MKSFAVEHGLMPRRVIAALGAVRALIKYMPDGLDCHEVCRRCGEAILGVEAVRGKFNFWDHSWLRVVGTTCVIDAYPWASDGTSFAVDTCTGSPWATLYKETLP